MTTRITPVKTTRAYASESATRMVTVTPTVMMVGVDYVVNLSTDLLMVFCANFGLPCLVDIISHDDRFGRTSNIVQSIPAFDIVGRIFSRDVWADENGDLNISVTQANSLVWFYEITNKP